jgi:hypothetical protein
VKIRSTHWMNRQHDMINGVQSCEQNLTVPRALYEKMGFRICGIKPNAIRLKDGTLLNMYAMIREIQR